MLYTIHLVSILIHFCLPNTTMNMLEALVQGLAAMAATLSTADSWKQKEAHELHHHSHREAEHPEGGQGRGSPSGPGEKHFRETIGKRSPSRGGNTELTSSSFLQARLS